MRVLTVCPTYGRIPFLNRMLSGFLHQTYDDKHLVIVNDDVNVELCCNESSVTCINLNRKILLPQKRNIAIGLGYYDIIMQYDDDDIFLPRKISNHIEKHLENPDIWMYRNSASYVVYDSEFIVAHSSPTVSSYTRESWYSVGGYNHHQNSGEDQEFFNKMSKKLVEHNTNKIDYVYNWGGVNYHATSAKNENVDKIAYDQLVKMGLVGKKYWIEPDFEQYNNFLMLDDLYREQKKPLRVKHIGEGKIDISHLQS